MCESFDLDWLNVSVGDLVSNGLDDSGKFSPGEVRESGRCVKFW